MTRERRRQVLAVLATTVVVVPLVWMWNASRLPGSYSVMDMGYVDTGGGPTSEHQDRHHDMGRSVASLTGPTGVPDVRMTLTARLEGHRYTVNGTSPGPLVAATVGQLLEITLVNDNVPTGVTLHWHGVDVPNAEDGVAGVTQDAVLPGGRHVYRWRATDAGTYWYHSHQVSHTQVQRGLLGPLVIRDRSTVRDEIALLHVYDGKNTLNGKAADQQVDAAPGAQVRVRVINTDNGVSPVWVSGPPYRVLAVDGRDVHEPGAVSGKVLRLTAGARADLLVTAPARVSLGGAVSMLVGTSVPEVAQPTTALDLLSYGAPAPLGFDPSAPDRRFRYSIGRRPGFVRGRPGVWWSINGHLYPDVPMFLVSEGDIVTMRIENHSGQTHPMHLHGHHAVVLARDGARASGSPWWVDSLDVPSGHSFDIAFVADNPGVWMDHCHNLPHAQQGLVAHLMYAGVTEPFRVNGRNTPE